MSPANTSPQITVTVSQPPKLTDDTPPETWNPLVGYFFQSGRVPQSNIHLYGNHPSGLHFNGSDVSCPGPFVVGFGVGICSARRHAGDVQVHRDRQ